MMTDWINHPGFQAAVAPFILAFLVALLSNRFRESLSGLSIFAGFIVTTLLITDISFEPLTSTRKIILVTILASIVGVIFQFTTLRRRYITATLATCSAIAALWILWPVLIRKELLDATIMGISSAIYCIWITIIFSNINSKSIKMSSAATTLGITTGGAATIGASAFLGQLSMSLGFAAIAYLCAHILLKHNRNQSTDTIFSTSFAIPIALLAMASTVYAKLPWYVLPLLALQPLMTYIPFTNHGSVYKRAILLILLTMVPGIAVLYLTWEYAGPVPI